MNNKDVQSSWLLSPEDDFINAVAESEIDESDSPAETTPLTNQPPRFQPSTISECDVFSDMQNHYSQRTSPDDAIVSDEKKLAIYDKYNESGSRSDEENRDACSHQKQRNRTLFYVVVGGAVFSLLESVAVSYFLKPSEHSRIINEKTSTDAIYKIVEANKINANKNAETMVELLQKLDKSNKNQEILNKKILFLKANLKEADKTLLNIKSSIKELKKDKDYRPSKQYMLKQRKNIEGKKNNSGNDQILITQTNENIDDIFNELN